MPIKIMKKKNRPTHILSNRNTCGIHCTPFKSIFKNMLKTKLMLRLLHTHTHTQKRENIYPQHLSRRNIHSKWLRIKSEALETVARLDRKLHVNSKYDGQCSAGKRDKKKKTDHFNGKQLLLVPLLKKKVFYT